jgi:hypothetical protein
MSIWWVAVAVWIAPAIALGLALWLFCIREVQAEAKDALPPAVIGADNAADELSEQVRMGEAEG